MKAYDEELLERIEAYLKGEMPEDESSAFRQQIETDEELRQMVEQHQLLMESIWLNNYLEEKRKLQAIHEEITRAEEEEAVERTEPLAAPKNRRVLLRRIASIAAVLLLGVVLGVFVIEGWLDRGPIQEDNTYGSTAQGLPVFEAEVPFYLIEAGENIPAEPAGEILLSLFESGDNAASSQLSSAGLELHLPGVSALDNLNNRNTSIILIKLDNPDAQIASLIIDHQSYQIPLTNETFDTLFDQ